MKEWRNTIVSALLERNVSMLYFNQKQFQLLYFVQDDDLPLGSLLSCNLTVGAENELNKSSRTSSSSDTEENFTDSDDNSYQLIYLLQSPKIILHFPIIQQISIMI